MLLNDQRPVRRVRASDHAPSAEACWPVTVPAVGALLRDGIDLPPGVTFLVGENGSGKSTLVEGVAMAYGLSPEGGSTQGMHATRTTESPLSTWLTLERSPGAPRWGFFLRAETMHGWYTFLEDHPHKYRQEPEYHRMSHGESFLAVLRTRLDSPGFYCLDEPEAALSFGSTLALIGALHDLAVAGSQVLCATHSPIAASLPGARILELGEWGMRACEWEQLELVQHHRSFLDAPRRYLRHLLED